MIVVIDASVAIKWFVRTEAEEEHTHEALEILAAAAHGHIKLMQPPHFIAEVAAVLTWLEPDTAQDDLLDLLRIEQEHLDSPEIYATAIEIASTLKHHLFDTLYHATALHIPDAIFVTADQRYYAKAHHLGKIETLARFQLPPPLS